ncbi:unnamed protein product [Brachionus calyciflorus]|uniref:Uncharacterized protein n=1 Tax=Brachionus calyciflorus TaxID=104777 RepID=A0A813NYB3_9BILA|nr:unnamed protein product [Brachionus calyciflorus]
MNTYLITVVTSNIKFAGTDSKVYIELYGTRNNSGQILLNNSKNKKNPFEQGSVDEFEIECRYLGSIKKIRIGHDNKGLNSGWHLKEVIIVSKIDGRVWLCESNQWFDKKEEDRKIERELIAIEQFNFQKKTVKFDPDLSLQKPFSPKSIYQDEEVIYKITTITSDLKQASTSANVYLKIFGKRGETGKILLEKSLTNKEKFKTGQTDIFEINEIDVGKIKTILIGHDNRGISPNWHLKEIIIEKNAEKYVFPCSKWFDKNQDDRLTERELIPIEKILDKSKRVHNFIGSVLNYDVNVKTSDINSGGTDANVFIKIYGEYRKSEFIELKNSLTHKNKFERGNIDKFNFKEEFFGEILKLKVKQDTSGISPNWHLSEIVIECAELGRKWIFPCNKWIEKNEQGLYQIELTPLENKNILTDSNLVTYVVDVYTADLPNSGTDSNVYITLYGEDSESTEFHLNNSETHLNKFERNQIDRFKIETNDLGKLIGIRIRHDNTGAFPSWFLDRVEIGQNMNKYEFICQKWFSTNRDDCKIDRIIKEKTFKNKLNEKKDDKPKQENKKDKKKAKKTSTKLEYYKNSKYYYLKMYTGSKQDIAGTDLNAQVKLFGDNCVSRHFKLNETRSHDSKFYRDQIDVFELETNKDLGLIYAIELRFGDCLSRANDLDLKKVEIYESNGHLYTFDYNKAISLRDPLEMQRILRLEKELRLLNDKPLTNISVNTDFENEKENDITLLAQIIGSKESFYDGAVFDLEIFVPLKYPFIAPKIKFKSQIIHPNVDDSGRICLDSLTNQKDWTPKYNIAYLLLQIQSLLLKPNFDDPLQPELAALYKSNPEAFKQKVLEQTRKHLSKSKNKKY